MFSLLDLGRRRETPLLKWCTGVRSVLYTFAIVSVMLKHRDGRPFRLFNMSAVEVSMSKRRTVEYECIDSVWVCC